MGTLEIEVKFFLPGIEPVRSRLTQAGASSHGRLFERNICFDNAPGDLHRSESLLRLRKYDKTTLTCKTKPAVHDPEFKVLKEFEVEVSNFDTTQKILEILGFYRTQVYEKYRETFSLGPTELCIDCMPFGSFLEIEGDRDNIRDLAQRIGMQWHRRIVYNYRSMFEIIRQELGLAFNDITFDNFRDVGMDVEMFLPRFEVS